MADAKISVSADDLASAVLDAVNKKLRDTGSAADESRGKLLPFQKAIDDLTPSTRNATAGFTDMRGIITDMWSSPLEGVQSLAGAMGKELTASLGETAITAGIAAGAIAGVGAVAVELASKAAGVGESVNDMALKMGESAAQVSNLRGAAIIAGGSLDQISTAMFMFQKNMGEGTDKFQQGLSRLGVSLDDLQKQSPAEQFLTIAAAVRDIDDPTQRAAAAVELFGRQGRDLLPLLMKPLDDLVEQSRALGSTWSNEDAKAAEELQMQFRALTLQVENIAVNIGKDLIPAVSVAVDWFVKAASFTADWTGKLSGITGTFTTARDAVHFLVDAYDVLAGKTADIPKASGDAKIALDAEQAALKNLQVTVPSLTSALANDKEEHIELDATIRESIATHEKYRQAVTEYLSAGTDYDDLIRKIGDDTYEGIAYDHARGISTETLAQMYGVTKTVIDQVVKSEADYKRALDDEVKGVEASRKAGEDAAAAIGKSLTPEMYRLRQGVVDATASSDAFNIGTLTLMPNLAITARQHMDELTGSIFNFGNALDETMAEAPQLIVNALTGGGGLAGAANAVGSTFGKSIGESIQAHIAQSIEDNTGEVAQGMTASLLKAIPVVGSLVGPLLAKLFSIGGPSQEELQGRQTEGQFETSMGGIAGIGKALTDAGLSADAANAKILALFAAEKQGGTAVQAVIDDINSTIKQHTTDVSTGVQTILDTAKTVGANFPAAMRPMLESLIAMPGLTDDERKALQALDDSGTPSLEDLTTTAAKYGLTLDDLGSKTQQLDISSKADQALKDFQQLTGSGADTGAVFAHMGSSFADLVDEAIKYGGTLPTAMKPILQNMIDAGDLTDSTGKKITDLSTITFDDSGDPLQKSIGTLTDALNHLSDILGGLPQTAADAAQGMADALNNASIQPIHVPIVYDQPAQSFAAEGYDISRPTRAIVGDAPGTTESILHASTVRDIVKAARNAGAAGAGLTAADVRDAVASAMQPLAQLLDGHFRQLPGQLRHAMRGA